LLDQDRHEDAMRDGAVMAGDIGARKLAAGDLMAGNLAAEELAAEDLAARDRLAGLRREIARIEGRPGAAGEAAEDGALLPLGPPGLDRLLGGGLQRGALHEIRAAETRESGAATGFAAALLARIAARDRRPLLWVAVAAALDEAGLPYGPGLERFGLDAGRLLLVRVRRVEEALWVFEEGLACTGLAAVLGEIRGHPRALGLTAGRRLALRAEAADGIGLLLRQAAGAEPGAAASRWQVAARPGFDVFAGVGRPAWRVELERNRAGPTGGFDLEWDHVARRFAFLSPAGTALPRSGAALSFHRPPAPAGTPLGRTG
jgi:protein ImuA